MKKLVLILAAFALLPVAAAADDLSAEIGGACQGIASLVTSGSTISYGILTDHPDPNQAVVMGPAGMTDLQANFGGTGSAAGTAPADSGLISAINANASAYTLRVTGPSGACQGALANNGGSGTGTAGTIEFGNASFSVIDTGGSATITVNRNGGSAGAVAVDYATADGSASAPADYTAASGTLSWNDGDADPKTFTVAVNDRSSGGETTVGLTLSNPSGGAELGLSAATLSIVDDQSLICVADADTLCLNRDGRFKAEVTWRAFDGSSGRGQAFEIGLRDSGLFYFFAEDNIEMLLKVLDACVDPFNAYWVFYAATTNVEFTLTVTDTQNGQVRTYSNPLGQAAEPILDTSAFDTSCP